MKVATISRKDHNDARERVYLIENEEDLLQYAKIESRNAEAAFTLGLKSTVPLSKFDHLIPSSGPLHGTMRLAWHRSQANDELNNPLFHFFSVVEDKIRGMRKGIMRGDRLIVNSNGGYMPCSEDRVEILSIEDGMLDTRMQKNLIFEDSNWIVLENDLKLPRQSALFLQRQDSHYSIVYDLRSHTMGQLKTELERFVGNGNVLEKTVFVYTTGLDVQQMYDYTKALHQVGLRRICFHFVSGTNEEIDAFLDFARTILSVEVLDHAQLERRSDSSIDYSRWKGKPTQQHPNIET